jgi:hypothetical protein
MKFNRLMKDVPHAVILSEAKDLFCLLSIRKSRCFAALSMTAHPCGRLGRMLATTAAGFGLVLALFVPVRVVGDDIVLKGGKKITGTIVGFENGMFKVETEYGYELVRKDKVETINITSGGEKAAEKAEKAKVKESPAATTEPNATSEKPVESATPLAGAKSVPPPPKVAAPAPPEPSHPLDDPLPAGLAEHIQGTNYYSDTFHFVMFKPPDWKLYEEISREKVSAIVAMSDENDRTLLIVDRTVWSGAPDLQADAVDGKIKGMVQDYAKTSEAAIPVGGQPAVRRTFTGVLDGAEWHGVSAHVAEGNTVFGIIGMTSAENFQFEEAVFTKIINSFRFLGSGAESGPAARQGEISAK